MRAALIGAPLPLCSCGVVPAALGLRDSGAGRGPTVSFLIATPETGVDSIALSYGMLGPIFAIVRPLAAVVSATLTGLVAGRWGTPTPAPTSVVAASCCGGDECQSAEAPATRPGWPAELRAGMRYAFTSVLADIGPWMLLGLAIAALTATFIPAEWFSGRWGYAASYLIMLLIGIPMYVCASASTPMAAGFLVAGISPGAVLVFLMAGPATNIGTLAILRKALGGRTVLIYIAGVMLSSLAFGLGLDGILTLLPGPMDDWVIPNATQWTAESTHAWIDIIATIILALSGLMLALHALKRRREHTQADGCCGSDGGCSGS